MGGGKSSIYTRSRPHGNSLGGMRHATLDPLVFSLICRLSGSGQLKGRLGLAPSREWPHTRDVYASGTAY